MRLVACALSAVLLSGCSWMGMGGGSHGQHQAYEGGRYGKQAAQYAHNTRSSQAGPCQIMTPMQPVPQGCRPEQVTLAIGNGHQGGQYNGGQYANAGYGSHAGQASANTQYHTPNQRKKRPKLRGSLGLEIDHSVSGNLFAGDTATIVAGYDRIAVQEGFTTGSIPDGAIVDTLYTSIPEQVVGPAVSFDDVYTAPLRITGGLEYIMNDHATVFANAGYTRAEGKKGGGAQIIDELRREVTTQSYDPLTGLAVGGPITNTTFIPNVEVANFTYDFNELEKYDFEVGGRYYFDPMLRGHLNRTLTPFVAASGGAAHYNDTTVDVAQQQLFLGDALESGGTTLNFYDVGVGTQNQVYDAQWVPYGQLKAGLEWQMTPKTALAFEAGVKYEGARDFTDGTEGDSIVSIPVAIRGSYNF